MMDNRALSVAVTHALTIAITAILLSGLLVTSGQFLDQQENRVGQDQFNKIGSDVVTHINSLDELNSSGENVTVEIEPNYPRTVADNPYTIILAEHDQSSRSDLDREFFDTEYDLRIESDAINQPVYFPVDTDTAITESSARGEDPTIKLCRVGDDQTIALERCP